MASRSRSTNRKKPLVLGFVGDGEVTKSYLEGALDQLIGDRDDVTIIVPATDASYNDSLALVLDWADENKVDFEAIIDGSTAKDDDLKSIASDAVKTYKSEDVGLQLVSLLDSADFDGRLIVFWDPDPETGEGPDDATEALETADTKDISAFNMCESMKPFEFTDPEAEAAASDEPADDDNVPDPEPVRRRRGKAAEDDAADAAETPKAKGTIPSAAALKSLGVVALKNLAKEHLGSTANDLKGLTKEELIALLLEAEPEDNQEAQSSAEVQLEAQRGEVDPDSPAGVLQAAVETAVAGLVDALVARFLFEMNKPRSAGRPRKDGTAAQARPKAAQTDDDADSGDDGDEPPAETRTRSRRRAG